MFASLTVVLLSVFGILAVAGGALRALERPDLVFRTYAFSTAVALTLGTGFVFLWGVIGAIVGLLVSYGTTATVAIYFYRRLKDLTPVRGRRDEVDAKQGF